MLNHPTLVDTIRVLGVTGFTRLKAGVNTLTRLSMPLVIIATFFSFFLINTATATPRHELVLSPSYAADEFVTTWKTDNPSLSPNNEITIPAYGFIASDYTVDWGDNTTDEHATTAITHTYAQPGTYEVKITGLFPHFNFGYGGDTSKLLSVEQWGNNPWQSMASAFRGAINLVVNATDAPNLSNVTDMSYMFSGATSFNQDISDWDVSNVTNMSYMFFMPHVFYGDVYSFNQPLNNWDVSSVTNMSHMFDHARMFNQPLDQWDTSAVTDMSSMFYTPSMSGGNYISGDSTFNGNIGAWNTGSVTNMSSMFYNAVDFDQDLSNWDTSAVTDMTYMFKDAKSFNSPLANWDTSSVVDIYGMFEGATLFNQPIAGWDVSNVTSLGNMFREATSFNQPLNSWNIANVEHLSCTFDGAHSFNQPLDQWDTTKVGGLDCTFREAHHFNQDISTWNTSNVYSMSATFDGASSFNQPLDNWDVSGVTYLMETFQNAIAFNQPLNSWDVSSVYGMPGLFKGADSFNQPLNNWNVSGVTSLYETFSGASSFDQPLDNWDTSGVYTLWNTFAYAQSFNQDISTWDTSGVGEMYGVFEGATSFNQPLNTWDTSHASTMAHMFALASSFNQPIGTWNTSNVTSMASMFALASSFNQSVSNFDTSNVTTMASMFEQATAFNQPLDSWDTGNVTTMAYMFSNQSSANPAAFDQPLGSWDVSKVTTMEYMLSMSNLSSANYDNALTGWASQNVRNDVVLGAHGLLYDNAGQDRASLISTFNWTIIDDSSGQFSLWMTPDSQPADGTIGQPVRSIFYVNYYSDTAHPLTAASFTFTSHNIDITNISISESATEITDSPGSFNQTNNSWSGSLPPSSMMYLIVDGVIPESLSPLDGLDGYSISVSMQTPHAGPIAVSFDPAEVTLQGDIVPESTDLSIDGEFINSTSTNTTAHLTVTNEGSHPAILHPSDPLGFYLLIPPGLTLESGSISTSTSYPIANLLPLYADMFAGYSVVVGFTSSMPPALIETGASLETTFDFSVDPSVTAPKVLHTLLISQFPEDDMNQLISTIMTGQDFREISSNNISSITYVPPDGETTTPTTTPTTSPTTATTIPATTTPRETTTVPSGVVNALPRLSGLDLPEVKAVEQLKRSGKVQAAVKPSAATRQPLLKNLSPTNNNIFDAILLLLLALLIIAYTQRQKIRDIIHREKAAITTSAPPRKW